MWQAGVGVTLASLPRGRHAAVAEAEAGRRAATLALPPCVRRSVPHAGARGPAPCRGADGHVYADGILPQARLSYEASIASYQAGKVRLGFSEALSTLYSRRMIHLRVLAAAEESSLDCPRRASSPPPSCRRRIRGMDSLAGAFGGAGNGGRTGARPVAAMSG